MQAVGICSAICQHANGAMITAVCCLTSSIYNDYRADVVVTATTTAEGVHILHIWQHEYGRDGTRIKSEACAVKELKKVAATGHPHAITSICAIPAGTLPFNGAAFVTCSKGDATVDGDHGTTRLWTMNGAALPMKLESGGLVEDSHSQRTRTHTHCSILYS
jgi:hypothetical protein